LHQQRDQNGRKHGPAQDQSHQPAQYQVFGRRSDGHVDQRGHEKGRAEHGHAWQSLVVQPIQSPRRARGAQGTTGQEQVPAFAAGCQNAFGNVHGWSPVFLLNDLNVPGRLIPSPMGRCAGRRAGRAGRILRRGLLFDHLYRAHPKQCAQLHFH